MTTITFKNNIGSFSIYGGGSGNIRILEIAGLGFPAKTFTSVTFNNTPGHKTTDINFNARTITISIDFKKTENAAEIISDMIRILNEEVEIYIDTGTKKRKICGNATAIDEGERQGNKYQKYSIQIICDNPYFTDFEITSVPALATVDKLTNGFVLPMVFTEFTNKGQIKNSGDTFAEPKIRIIGFEDNEITSINIVNNTIQKSLLLHTAAQKNEIITVDIAKRKITSNVRDEFAMLEKLDLNSYLSDFTLIKGTNDIEVLCSGDNQNKIGVTVEYDNQYLEAVL